MRIKLNIGTKLFITYFLLLLLTFSLSLTSFNILSHRYLINETKEKLKLEANTITELFKNATINNLTAREKVVNRLKIEVANRSIDANVIITSKDRNVIYSNMEFSNSMELSKIVNQINKRDYISVRLPIIGSNQTVIGNVIVFSKVKDVKELNNLMLKTLILSFTIAGLIALVIGLILERSLTKPLIILKDIMSSFSLKKPLPAFMIKTGDEIEELGLSFKQMANKIVSYDEQQKAFLQNASHELKTPLMAIQGNAEAIKEGVVEGNEVDSSLNIIIGESQRLKKIVDEIIFLTKLENIEESFNFAPEGLYEIINKAINSLKYLADANKVKIIFDNNTNIIIGEYDYEKLARALINIIGNCIRYAKKQINIDVFEWDDYIEILIEDDGIGFKHNEQNKIFNRFYKGKNGGTGIGLSIAKIIIEGHRGTIEAFNNENGGATFKISLQKKKIPLI